MSNLSMPILNMVRSLVYRGLYSMDSLLVRQNDLFIICYHGIADDGWLFSINIDEFKRQMELILENYNPVSLSDIDLYLSDNKPLKKPSFLLTFDDGYKDILSVADYLKEVNIPPAVFILSDTEEEIKKVTKVNKPIIDLSDVTDLLKKGWTIGCHGARHRNYFNLTDDLIVEEIINSKIKLEESLKTDIKYFAYPRGQYTPRVLAAVKSAGYRVALTMDDGFIGKDTDCLLLPRIGVNRYHSLSEFKTIYSPSSIVFRNFVKRSPLGNFVISLY